MKYQHFQCHVSSSHRAQAQVDLHSCLCRKPYFWIQPLYVCRLTCLQKVIANEIGFPCLGRYILPIDMPSKIIYALTCKVALIVTVSKNAPQPCQFETSCENSWETPEILRWIEAIRLVFFHDLWRKRLPRWWAILSTPHPRTTTLGLPSALQPGQETMVERLALLGEKCACLLFNHAEPLRYTGNTCFFDLFCKVWDWSDIGEIWWI